MVHACIKIKSLPLQLSKYVLAAILWLVNQGKTQHSGCRQHLAASARCCSGLRISNSSISVGRGGLGVCRGKGSTARAQAALDDPGGSCGGGICLCFRCAARLGQRLSLCKLTDCSVKMRRFRCSGSSHCLAGKHCRAWLCTAPSVHL